MNHIIEKNGSAYRIEQLTRGYGLHDLCEQQSDHSGENRLRYANVCFCRGI